MPRGVKGRQGRGHPPVDKHRDIDCSNCISEETICAHTTFSATSPPCTHLVQQWLHYNDDIYKINVCFTGLVDIHTNNEWRGVSHVPRPLPPSSLWSNTSIFAYFKLKLNSGESLAMRLDTTYVPVLGRNQNIILLHISVTLLRLKCRSTELPFIHTMSMHNYLTHLRNTYEPVPNGSSAIQYFECVNTICNGIKFNFCLGLPHMGKLPKTCKGHHIKKNSIFSFWLSF